MYQTIIKFKENTSPENLQKLKDLCQKEHFNRAGSVKMEEISELEIIFKGEETLYGCLQLANLNLSDSLFFRNNVISWYWEDEDPDESCNLLTTLQI